MASKYITLGRSRTDISELSLTWKDLNAYVKVRNQKYFERNTQSYKKIINNVTGAVQSGNLVILMGSSGAGKSTLMGALACRNASDVIVEGDVRINGEPVSGVMHKISGFMHQEDLFVGTLTVREHLFFMARLKLHKNISNTEINRIVNKILTEMSLEKCANTKIGIMGEEKGISGGEKKRLSFATEVFVAFIVVSRLIVFLENLPFHPVMPGFGGLNRSLTDPPILFCDEPTTGLDSYSAEYLVNIMKDMSSRGKMVLCTIHQPSSDLFAMFQQLILLTDGRIAFMGDTERCITFFKRQGYDFPLNYNPAEILIKALSASSTNNSSVQIKRLCDDFAVSEIAQETNDLIRRITENKSETSKELINRMIVMSKRSSSFMVKSYWLIYRSLLNTFRDSSVQNVRILQKLGIALMASLCFNGTINLNQAGVQSVQGAIFIMVTENTFPPMYGVLSLIPEEFPMILPGLIIEPVLFVLVAYFISGLKCTLYAFLMTNVIAILTANVAAACGCFFSCVFESVSVALAFLVPLDYTLMVTSGVFIKLSSMPIIIAWFKYFSWFLYANEALSIVQWENVNNLTCEFTNPDIPCLKNGAEVLKKFDFSSSDLFTNIIAMASMFWGFHILGYLFLWIRIKRS